MLNDNEDHDGAGKVLEVLQQKGEIIVVLESSLPVIREVQDHDGTGIVLEVLQ